MNQEIINRLQILEEKFEYQERTVDALNDVIIEQQSQISQLEETLTRLQSYLATSPSDQDQGGDPPPPHY